MHEYEAEVGTVGLAKAEAVGTIKQRLWEMTEKMEEMEA